MLAYVNIGQKIDENRLKIFDTLEKRKEQISNNFDRTLKWIRHQEKSLSRIAISCEGDIESADSDLEEIREWHIENLLKLKKVFQPEIEQALKTLE